MIYSSPPSTAASTCAAAYTQPGSVVSKDDHKLPTLPGDALPFPCLVICCVFYHHAQQQGSVEGGRVAKSLQGREERGELQTQELEEPRASLAQPAPWEWN